jgi:hypothetical protein
MQKKTSRHIVLGAALAAFASFAQAQNGPAPDAAGVAPGGVAHAAPDASGLVDGPAGMHAGEQRATNAPGADPLVQRRNDKAMVRSSQDKAGNKTAKAQ